MTIQLHTPRAVYLRCELRVGLWNGDTPPSEFSDPMNFTKAEINVPPQEQEKLLSNMISTYGEALDSQNKPTDPAAASLEFSTLTPRMIELALGADVTEETQTGDTVTDEAFDTALDIWVPLANRYLDSGTAMFLETSADVEVATTKYEVDYVNGMIKAIHADAVGTGMKATYDTITRTWEEYAAGKAKSGYVQLIGQAIDKVTAKTGILEIYKASLAAGGAFDPVVGGYLNGNLQGDLITPTGYASPWRWQAVTA